MRRPVVVLVEDCPNDLALMRLAIAEAQFPCETRVLTDGQQAVDWLLHRGAHTDQDEEVYPALVLLDLKLPLLGGLDVLKALREDPQGRSIPVVVLTTSEMPTDISQAYAFGANAFVQKPMGFPALVALVQALGAFWLSFNVTDPRLR